MIVGNNVYIEWYKDYEMGKNMERKTRDRKVAYTIKIYLSS